MNFGEVFSRAWEIIWKNKILWLFGLLASLAGGSGSSNLQFNNRLNSNEIPFGNTERFFENIPPWIPVLLALFAFALVIVFIILGALGRAGLIRGAWLADGGESGLTAGRLFGESKRYFWRVILFGILILVAGLALGMAMILATVGTLGIALICLLPFICLLVPISIAAAWVIELSMVAIIGEDVDIVEGLRRGWQVFTSHLGEVIGIGLIIVIASAVVHFLISLPMLLVLAPVFTGLITQSSNWMRGGIIVSIVLFLLYLPILLAAGAVIQSYIETTWTLTYRRLTGRTAGNAPVLVEPPAEPVV